jgi:hypothetical protein
MLQIPVQIGRTENQEHQDISTSSRAEDGCLSSSSEAEKEFSAFLFYLGPEEVG